MIETSFFSEYADNEYDNTSAYEQLQIMMQQGTPISVSFGVFDYRPCVWVSNKNTRSFPYQIKEESFNGLLNYLQTGEITDFDPAPIDLDSITQEEVDNFTQDIIKEFVESGINIQYTPLFREYSGNVSGIVTFKKGTIFLKTKRTTEFMDYLRENKLKRSSC